MQGNAEDPLLEFQSTPVITDGRTQGTDKDMDWREKFQSTPVITDGRTWLQKHLHPCSRCFNPRPSSLTGEHFGGTPLFIAVQFQSTPVITDGRTADQPEPWHADDVSIHARHH